MQRALAILGIFVGVALLALAQRELVHGHNDWEGLDYALLLPPPQTLKVVAGGFEDVIVDMLWISAVQKFGEHYGGKPMTADEYRRFALGMTRIIDSITLIDPDWRTVYVNGGSMLGVMGMSDAELLVNERGASRFDEDWYFPFHIGMHYWEIGRRGNAAEHITEAAERAIDSERAPPYLSGLAATMLMDEDRGELALVMLEEQLRRITVPRARTRAQLRLMDAYLCYGSHLLRDALVDSLLWSNQADRDPASLVQRGYLHAVPECPLGGAWYWDAERAAFHCTGYDQKRRSFMVDNGIPDWLWDDAVRCP